jgi:hypothetical protein
MGVMDCLRRASLLLAFAAPVAAQEAPPASRVPEPNVQQLVVEDDGVRIEELRVRGQTQRIVVHPKKGLSKPYEIVPADRGRDMSQGAGSGRAAAGQRVWPVLAF